jgi:hypothetical protein
VSTLVSSGGGHLVGRYYVHHFLQSAPVAGFLKIDCDTGELAVLKTGISLLTTTQVCVFVETHRPQLEKDWESLGYSCQIIKNA